MVVESVVAGLIGRLFDKSKPTGVTNLTTLGGAGIVLVGVEHLTGGGDTLESLLIMGAGLVVTFIKAKAVDNGG